MSEHGSETWFSRECISGIGWVLLGFDSQRNNNFMFLTYMYNGGGFQVDCQKREGDNKR